MPDALVVLKSLAFAAFAGYAGLAGLMWLSQESLIFLPQPSLGKATAPPGWTLEPVNLAARDGTRLAGVIVRPPIAGRVPLLIFYGGNAEEVTLAAAGAHLFGPRAFLAVNYRGYGASEGRPSEAALVADALEVHDWAAKRADIDPARVALHGRSLGSGVAVQVAQVRPVKCIVLTSPMDSVRDVAQALYPWLPVSALLRHPFDSIARAPGMRAPALFLMAGDDRVIAPRHSERLAAAWGAPVERVTFAGHDHNDLELHEGYFKSIAGFLDRCL